jgi:iron complex outermembrane recepter protein
MRWVPMMAALLLVPAGVAAQGSVRGTVRDDAGAPLAGARVAAGGARAVSDDGGRFVLGPLAAGERTLEVALLGHAPASVRVRVGADRVQDVEIVLARTPLELPALRVDASPGEGGLAGIAQATTRLSGRALDREVGGSLAATLASQPGMSVRSMGPAATMPVLRGLTGDRVLVLNDGVRAGDMAGSADDHATTLDPLSASRVEVVRGPAALLHGNNALGGVVNVVSGDIPTHRPARAEWSLSGLSESAHPGAGASARLTLPAGERWAVSARVGGRRAGEVRLPGAERLENTASESRSASLGATWLGARAGAGGALRVHDFAYGLPVAPGADPVRLEGYRREAQGRLETAGLRVSAGAQRYEHDELDAATGELLQRFSLGTTTAELLLRGEGRALGATVLLKDYAARGAAALTPPARSSGAGVFAYRELPAGPLRVQVGTRWDGYRIRSADAEKFGPGRGRAFSALSGSAGASLPLGAGARVSASVSRAFRAPTVEELFSDAAHAGTGAVELGDASLRAEHATAIETGLAVERPRWALHVAAYRNRIGDYVHLVSRGDTVIGGATLPVLAYAQAAATLRGVEGSAEVVAAPSLVLAVMADAVRGERADGTPLSWMPAPRAGASARWERGVLSLSAGVRHTLAQERVGAADELPTAAHTLAHGSAGLRFRSGGGVHAITLRIENAGDASYREATSRIRDFAPGPGRSVSLLYRWIR